jgi:hypothetical protein
MRAAEARIYERLELLANREGEMLRRPILSSAGNHHGIGFDTKFVIAVVRNVIGRGRK